MKSAAFAAVALLTGSALAQPHHARHAHQARHQAELQNVGKRTVTETTVVVETQTAYVYVDASTTVTSHPDAQFFTKSTSSSSSSAATTTSSSSSEVKSSSTKEQEKPTTTSTPAATTKQAEPTTTSTKEATVEAATSTQAAAPKSSSSSSSGSSDTSITSGGNSGFITYYDTGLGACGYTDTGSPTGTFDDPMIVALSYNVFFANLANTNNFEHCNSKIAITSADAPGKVAYGIVRDACQACTTIGDIDVNIQGMKALYPDAVTVGKGHITWKFV